MNLDNVVPGDVLFVPSTFSYSNGTLETVRRVTSTQVVTDSARFRKSDGRRFGDSGYSICYARIPSPQDVLRVRIRNAEESLRSIRLNESTIGAAEALIQTVQDGAKK